MKYERTVFKARWDKAQKAFLVDPPSPPAGDGWRMVNFQPLVSPEPVTTAFVAVWERDEESNN
jgi:hypothetical protein